MRRQGEVAVLLLASLGCLRSANAEEAARRDVLLWDFEGKDYAGWKTDGKAFGKAPMTRPRTIGHNGNGVASSLEVRNMHTGRLTSPEFTYVAKNDLPLFGM